MSPFVALLRHTEAYCGCPVIGLDRKSSVLGQSDAIDPKQ